MKRQRRANNLTGGRLATATRHAGFSLVELVMVLVIVAVAGAMAAPRYARAVGRYRTDAAVKRWRTPRSWLDRPARK
ncbi:MAG: type II secretion system GspH family protein [Phycisphaerae bacterium]|nr:type II secretion system GspH family protein [Phycisphaerae bacterium]